jgi:hypothetical protein
MTNPRRVNGCLVDDGQGGKRMVKPGDTVGLSPPPQTDGSNEAYYARENYEFLKRWLGEGPFEVSWIGEWPCRRRMLYLKLQDGREPGTWANGLVYVEQSRQSAAY